MKTPKHNEQGKVAYCDLLEQRVLESESLPACEFVRSKSCQGAIIRRLEAVDMLRITSKAAREGLADASTCDESPGPTADQ
jgi:hypothetical protein